ncbi:AfsR/SARP family transcriptional regulator [Lentzea nigeriaca]|uniref:AfsR/SARP family transcriptional regulator n=1 Tax=Lentzea nigeriaca TaxID=1128665 RepID=UPI0019566078|nr:BTAD domain-containing putative transcriptional regulator [Lentzea nigeriaca]MBM7864454.1 DNA-binding SARP family transcriptional activator/Flp pilus assembly protein TadD [Lentzea nigeriaca]
MAGRRVPDDGIRVLGPLEVDAGDGPLDPGGPRLRAMLALLAAYAGRPVSVSMFVSELWGPAPPPDAERTVRTYVSRLRRGVGPLAELIRTRPPGYLLLEPEIVDAVRFQRLAREGRAALAEGAFPVAHERLTAALALWRGRAYDEFDGIAALEAERTRLEGVRLNAVQDRVDADLAAGSGGELVTELTDLTAAHPGHERLWGQLMTALYRAGRQADALEAFRRARRQLVEHAGVEPSPLLTDIQERILAHDSRLLAATADLRPAQLPPVVRGFTGREAQLAALDNVVAAAQDTVAVVAVCGTAGVGKTALAVRWAHRVAARFPDGQLYVNLRGFDPDGALPPEEALHGFLTALGADRIPDVLHAQVALYRSLTAGKRFLVVLDNARDAAHVRPLLPSEPGSAVVITSRDDLIGLVARDGASRVGLDVLGLGEAVELLRLLVDEKVAAQEELEELAERCVRLPLALRVAAELVARRGRVGLEDLADEHRRLDLMDAGADADTAVRAVFSWSERHLPPAANRLFWLLGLHPGRDSDTAAVAALAGVEARELLDVLHGAHLVESAGAGRWTMHDLLRAFARERAEQRLTELDRHSALKNVYEHYLTTALDAMDAVYPYTRLWRRGDTGDDRPSSMTSAAAKTWLDTERLTLVTITSTASGDLAGYAVRMARAIDQHLNVGFYNADAFSVHQHALAAAEDLGDEPGRARALLELGRSHARAGAYGEADEHYRRALRLYRRLGDLVGEARTLHALGNNEGRVRRNHDALASYGLALTLSRQAGDRAQEAVELASIGQVQHSLGRHEEALAQYRRAAAIYEEIGERVGQGRILNDLGTALQSYGRLEEAHDHHRRALAILHDVGDRAAEAIAHTDLGRICSRWGRHTEALEHHRQAITVFREIGDLVGETEVLINLGLAHEGMGRHGEAADLHQQAETFAAKLGDRLLECAALNGRGRAARASGRYAEAIECHEQALVHAREMEDREQEARSLDELAAAHERTGAIAEARRLWTAALPIYGALRMPEAAAVRQRLGPHPGTGNT